MTADPGALLAGLAAVNAELASRASECRAALPAATTSRGCAVRGYQGKYFFEAFVEVDMSDVAVCWWIDLAFPGSGWTLDRSIRRTDREGQRSIRSSEDETADWPDLGGEFPALTRELARRESPASILREAFAGR